MTPVNLAGLNTGPFQATPKIYRPKFSTSRHVFHIESRRMMEYLVSPYDVDPDMSHLGDTRIIDQLSFDSVTGVFPDAFKPIVERNYLIGGALTSRSNNNLRSKKFMTISILRFPSDAAARTATADFVGEDERAAEPRHRIALEGVENAVVTSTDDVRARLFASQGPYVVLSQFTAPQADPKAIAAQFRKMLGLQFAKLRNLMPTPVDDILDLPSDPDRIMSVALPPTKGASGIWQHDSEIGTYSPAGQLHFERDAAVSTQAFTDAGVDLIAQNDGIVYRTRDLESAFRLQTALAKLGKNDEEIAGPPGIADAHCIKLDEREPIRDGTFLCALVYGRYLAIVSATSVLRESVEPSFYQRAAAQYSILAASG
ncbi:hypothetical protein ACLMAJ_11325 [Nocardia sp. KC 131]|uniref:DUF7373 family lipoprotein n=1 Tax=Nocardia arseniciresistens TaxID=3392119 RepID=UPI00398F47E8